jgi:hypothetical protein
MKLPRALEPSEEYCLLLARRLNKYQTTITDKYLVDE